MSTCHGSIALSTLFKLHMYQLQTMARRFWANCKLGLLLFCHSLLFILLCLWYNQRLIVYPFGFKFITLGYSTQVHQPRVPYVLLELVTKDKVKLRCLLIPHSSSTSLRGTVIIFHGNAMNCGHVIDSHAVYLSNQGFTVLSAEYRGFGHSEGTPSESGLRRDAQAALDFVTNDPKLSKTPIVICGHSLGGAIAIDVTSRNTDKVSALIIENTFCSIPSLVQKWRMGRFLSLLTTQKWYSASKIAKMPPSLPILMLSGLWDSVIPPGEMEELWEVAKKRCPKKNTGWFGSVFRQKDEGESLIITQPDQDVFETFSTGSHNDMCLQYGYWTVITKFLDDIVPSPLLPSSPTLSPDDLLSTT